MANLKDTPLQIPDQWAAAWFRNFVVETLAKADIRNAIGVGVTITSTGNSVATITADASAALTPHIDDPFAHVAAFGAHRAEADPHPQYLTAADVGATAVHDEPLTDGLGGFIFDGTDIVVVVGVPN